MRVTRSLLLLSGVALLVAGCAAQPVAYMPMAAAPSSLDSMTYGAPAAATYAYPPSSRGLFQQTVGYQQTYAAAYPQTYAAAAYPQAAPAVPAPVPAAPQPAFSGYYNYSSANPAAAAVAPLPVYTLDSGDRLRIVVFGQDGLTNSYAVDASGHISMPLIGSVMARGLTTDELQGRIVGKLKDGFIREPHVAVEIEAYRPFFILGEVTQPGQYPYVANMTAETAVAIAGGFSPRAVRRTVIINRNINGQQVRMSVPLSYEIRPGDTLNVQERWF
jgi:protein involved in polysaccharide export with SLBB domain